MQDNNFSTYWVAIVGKHEYPLLEREVEDLKIAIEKGTKFFATKNYLFNINYLVAVEPRTSEFPLTADKLLKKFNLFLRSSVKQLNQ